MLAYRALLPNCSEVCHVIVVPVCPHAGGVGLCEMVQHLSIFDYICIARTFDNRYSLISLRTATI